LILGEHLRYRTQDAAVASFSELLETHYLSLFKAALSAFLP
jgi:hypothetical protein